MFPKLIVAGVLLMSLASCDHSCNHTNNHTSMNTHNADNKQVYACPMHPDVTGKSGEKCPKCGMELEAVQSASSGGSEVNITSMSQAIEAGKPSTLSVSIMQNGKAVDLDVVHEMQVHMLVVNEGLTWFDHIHPEKQADGTYKVTETFPGGGKYLLFTDYKPTGAAQNVDRQEIEVTGKSMPATGDDAAKLASVVDGYKVNLINGGSLKTNQDQALEFSIEKDGKQLKEADIEPYLGASAHIVMIGKQDKDFLHIHPVSNDRFPVYAETSVEKPGIYRMWVQFKIDGKLHIADFTVNVSEGEQSANHSEHQHHQH